MRIPIRLLLLSIFAGCAVTGFAQWSEEEGGIETKNGYLRYLGIGAGATYQVMNDEAISPITYSRIGALPMIDHIKVNNTNMSEVTLRASILNLTHNTERLMKEHVKNQRAVIDYRLMKRIPFETRRNNTDLRAGVMLSGMFAYKNAPFRVDASRVYEYAASLGPTGRITKQGVWGEKTVFFSWDVAIPVVANVARPQYMNRRELSDPENSELGDFIGNSKTGTFGTYFRLNSRVSLMRRMENGNAILISYQWDYSKIKTNNKVFFAEHMVSLLFMFNY